MEPTGGWVARRFVATTNWSTRKRVVSSPTKSRSNGNEWICNYQWTEMGQERTTE